MFGWMDGHEVAVFVLCPVAAYVLVSLENGRRERRIRREARDAVRSAQRALIFARRGAR